jgi:hypothetical protein
LPYNTIEHKNLFNQMEALMDTSFDDYTQSGGYAVLIEWDGKRPPTRWYDRLRSLGYKVQGSKDASPLARRDSHNNNGITFQEGALLCREESEARTLAHLANEMGAANAMVITYTALDLSMSEQDFAALSRIQSTLGRRGRPPAATPKVTVCHDCGKASDVFGASFRCHYCGGTDISQRDGQRTVIRLAPNLPGSPLGYIASRYLETWHEEPDIQQDNPDAVLIDPAGPNYSASHSEVDAITHTEAYRLAEEAYQKGLITWENLYRIMDIIRLVQTRGSERRTLDRVTVIQRHIRAGGDIAGIRLDSRLDKVDLFDCAAITDPVSDRLLRRYHFNA